MASASKAPGDSFANCDGSQSKDLKKCESLSVFIRHAFADVWPFLISIIMMLCVPAVAKVAQARNPKQGQFVLTIYLAVSMVSLQFLLLLLQAVLASGETCPEQNHADAVADVDVFEAAMKEEGPETALDLLQVQKTKARV